MTAVPEVIVHAAPRRVSWPMLVRDALLPVAVQAVLYAAVGVVNADRVMHDDTLLRVEHSWFGSPWRDWATRWPSAGVSLLLHGCYLAYYLVLTVPYARLLWRGEREAWRQTFRAHVVTLTVGCLLYLLWPVEGPRFREPIDATVLPDVGHQFTNWMLATFSARGTAFPSSHVSLALTQLLMAWRYQRAMAYAIAPVLVGIGAGAVYGGYHYLIDVLAGIVLGVVCVMATVRFLRPSVVIGCLLAAALIPGRAAGAQRFYQGRDYGSERQFNPLSQILNEGYDLLRSSDADRRVLIFPYGVTARNLRTSLASPGAIISRYGRWRYVRHELLPLSLKAGGGGQWVPNYQFHLLGSGMVSARMTEWFKQHGYAHPAWWSFATMTASHVLNEMTERPTPRSVDAITDLLIFDPAGFLLFRSERVQRAFSGRMQLTNWPLQPGLTLPGETIENVGQQFVLRVPIPKSTQWRGLYLFGVSTLVGVSRDLGNGRSLSFGAGADVVRIPVVDSLTDTRTVELEPNLGVFYDRDGSLLWSVLARLDHETLLSVNLYPAAISKRLPVGLWMHLTRERGVRLGVATPAGFGIGYRPGAIRDSR